VRGHDERRPRGEGRREPGGHEEVGVGDIGTEPTRSASGVADEGEMARPAASSPIDDRTLELVTARGELALEARHEDAEVRVGRPRVHLRDEEDPQLERSASRA